MGTYSIRGCMVIVSIIYGTVDELSGSELPQPVLFLAIEIKS
jgi:hypothetical protein